MRDVVRCGAGQDRVFYHDRIDAPDRLFSCEIVRIISTDRISTGRWL
jgi:hypothetical protein